MDHDDDIGVLRDNLEKAVGGEAPRQSITVKLSISGGLPEQAYALDFEATGDGYVRCAMDDRLTGRRAVSGRTALEGDEFAQLLNQILTSRALDHCNEPPRFLPDTLVGRLEISDGETSCVVYFAADPDQAMAHREATGVSVQNSEFRAAADAIYGLCSRVTGDASVAP